MYPTDPEIYLLYKHTHEMVSSFEQSGNSSYSIGHRMFITDSRGDTASSTISDMLVDA